MVWLALLAASMMIGCSDDDNSSGPDGTDPLHGAWKVYDPDGDLQGFTYYYFFQESAYQHLTAEIDGWRSRYDGTYTHEADTLTFDSGWETSYRINGDTLLFDQETFLRDPDIPTPDSFVKHVEVVDSVEGRLGDMTWNGTNLLVAESFMYRFSTDPLALLDSTHYTSSLHAAAWDENWMWLGYWSDSLRAVNPSDGTVMHLGPRLHLPSSFAWGDNKLWLCDTFDDLFMSYDPGTGTFQDSLIVDLPLSDGVGWLDGYLYLCVYSRLYKCETSPFRIVQGWQFEDQSIPGNNLRTMIRYMATDGVRVWLNTQRSDGTMDATIYEVRL